MVFGTHLTAVTVVVTAHMLPAEIWIYIKLIGMNHFVMLHLNQVFLPLPICPEWNSLLLILRQG